jgi:DHA2 family multidrug resistance protein
MSSKAEHLGFKDIFAFAVMTFGMFIALLDIQIVASSMQQIGGGR